MLCFDIVKWDKLVQTIKQNAKYCTNWADWRKKKPSRLRMRWGYRSVNLSKLMRCYSSNLVTIGEHEVLPFIVLPNLNRAKVWRKDGRDLKRRIHWIQCLTKIKTVREDDQYAWLMRGSPFHSRIFSSSGNSGIKVIQDNCLQLRDLIPRARIQFRKGSVVSTGRRRRESSHLKLVQETMLLELALLLLI